MWVGDKSYSDLIMELWGSPGRWNVKKRYVDVAKKLGVDEETVRNRVRSLKESGFLLGWRLLVNPALFNRRNVFLLLELEDPDSKEQIIGVLKKSEGVIVAVSIHSDELLVTLCDDEDGTSSKKISEMEGIKTNPLSVAEMSLPPSNFKMGVTDWRIVSNLVRDAEKDPNEVGRELKVSSKTVKRRLDAMMEASAILIMPMVNLRKSSGISFNLMVQAEEGRKTEVEKLVAPKIENLAFRADASKNGFILGFTGSNIVQGEDLLRWTKRLSGVRSARINIAEEVHYVFDWLERAINDKITAAS